ncbi:MAG TPA: penicillin-binding protein 2 [Longimicrobiales bacterium]
MIRTGRTATPRGRRRIRAEGGRVAVAVAVAALGFGLMKLQVLDVRDYALMARENRLRSVMVPAPRGTIYDRTGQIIADNVVGYQIMLMPAPRDTLSAQLQRLQPALGLSDFDIQNAFKKWRREPHLPMVVLADAPATAVARMEERRFLFPQVLISSYPKREYPAGEAVGHFIGYVAEISQGELSSGQFAGYSQGRIIGKAGLERSYETALSGQPGMRFLEVDAMGHIKRWLPDELGVPPLPGKDLQLYLDLDLQKYMQHIFPDTMNGAMVALDPRTGGVLAYYASPGYDPNEFIGGVSSTVWNGLRDDPRVPLLDRAGGAAQPPGSTYKLAVASMALELGAIKPKQYMPIPCTGGMEYQGRYARCWYHSGHGYLDLPGAIKNSCDVYFYQVGIKIGLKKFLEEGTRLGFGSRTLIDLPRGQEIAPSFPASLAWWRERFGYEPADNEIMSLAIGQGAVTATPLKLAQIYTALAREDGQALAPRFVQTGASAPVTFRTYLQGAQVSFLRQGMREVVGPGGTAALSRLRNWDFMGKTGTAQNPHGPDHGLFVGIGGPWGGEPEIVVATLIEHGLHGAIASGYAADAINFYLDRKYGRTFDPYPTPRDRIAHNLPIDWPYDSAPVGEPYVARPKPPAGPRPPRVLGTPVQVGAAPSAPAGGGRLAEAQR